MPGRSGQPGATGGEPAPAGFGPAGAVFPVHQEHRARLRAALVALALGKKGRHRRHQPILALESLPETDHARVQKSLAPVRPFPVSIRRRGNPLARLLPPDRRDKKPGQTRACDALIKSAYAAIFWRVGSFAGAHLPVLAAGVPPATEDLRPAVRDRQRQPAHGLHPLHLHRRRHLSPDRPGPGRTRSGQRHWRAGRAYRSARSSPRS